MISDLHANPFALEAVLQEIEDVDLIYCLGDIVGIGPLPAETVDMLIGERRIRKVLGNHDHNTLHGTELGPIREIPRRPHHDWVRAQLSGEHMEHLRSDKFLHLEGPPELSFMHRHPGDCWSKVPYFYDSSPEVLDSFYEDVRGEILFFGHTHIPLDVKGEHGRRYVNPGAVGAENAGLARFVRLRTDHEGKYRIHNHAVPYDTEAVKDALEQRAPPYWEFIIDHFFGPHPAGYHR